MTRWLPHPILTPGLVVVWLLLNNSFSFGTLLAGVLLGWAIPVFTLAFWPDRVRIRKPFILLHFAGMVLFDILVANLRVARLILVGPRHLRPAFVVVPLALKDDLAISVLANTICLTPGTVSACLAPDRTHLLVHALDVADPQGLIRTIKARYEAPLAEVFAC